MISPIPTQRAWAEIDLEAISSNVRALKAALGSTVRLLAVVKADAYGHGLIPVSETALAAGADWLGVAAVAEGAALRHAGIDSPIALLCVPAPDEAECIVANRITPVVGDKVTLAAIAKAAEAAGSHADPFAIHMDIDTGMGRSGVQPGRAADLWRAANDAGLRVTGLMTHFADAENPQADVTIAQRRAFHEARELLAAAGAHFDVVHANNSAATLNGFIPAGNLVRPGLLLYGIWPAMENTQAASLAPLASGLWPRPSSLIPALTLKARVATVRELAAGHTVSYGATHRLARPSRIATVLIGYGDGYPRRLSNRGCMLLNGKRAPILGRICMDQTVVDVTDIPGVEPGDEAVSIGEQAGDRIAVEEIAALVETTEHEITTCLTRRIPRLHLPARFA